MTVQVSTTGPRGVRSGARSRAAQRAYDRRHQRATLHTAGADATAVRLERSGGFAARIPFVAIIIGLLSSGLAVTLLLTTRSAEDSYQLSAARAHNQSLTEQRAGLRRDVEAANSAPVLASEAAKLGMIASADVARLVVQDDGSVRVVGTPKPAQGAPVVPLDPVGARQAGQPGHAGVAPGDRALGAPGELVPLPSRTSAPVQQPAPPVQQPASPPAAGATPPSANSPQLPAHSEQLVPVIPTAQPASGGRR